jgi:uncharacterized protein (TIGR02246 family)
VLATVLAALLASAPVDGHRKAASATGEGAVRGAVAAAIERQVQAWNRGDLEGFVSVYAEDAAFVSPTTGLTRGRQAVLDRYRKRYADKAAMGMLSLEIVETRAFGADGASVVARWSLAYPDRPTASGLTLLVLRAHDGAWLIVQDASM